MIRQTNIVLGSGLALIALCVAPLVVSATASAAPSERAQEVRNWHATQKNNWRHQTSRQKNTHSYPAYQQSTSGSTNSASAEEVSEESIAEKRQKLCENHQATIANKVQAFGGSADKNYQRVTTVFNKLVGLKEETNLHVNDYENLLGTAATKQEAARAAISQLKALSDGVDCSSEDSVAQLAAVKEKAAATRTALKEYKQSVKTLLSAVRQTLSTTGVKVGRES